MAEQRQSFDRKVDAVKGNLIDNYIGSEVKESMYEYGMYTLEDRSVPAVTDGFKPVYRRALFTMYMMGATQGKPHKKVARITGDTIGKYHPHGDSSVYNVIVEMAHTRYQLVDPQGNFGSDLTKAAAGRYIEARLSKFGTMVCDRMHIAKMIPNFDGEEKEPYTIPTRIPILLLNGVPTGIAVGLRIGIPSHNIKNVVSSLTYLLKTEKAKEDKFLELLDRPDFGECVIHSSKEELREIYKTGYGSISVGPKVTYKQDNDAIILQVTGLPPSMNGEKVVEKIREYQREGLVDYVEENIQSITTVNGKKPICGVSIRAASKKFLEDTILPHFYSSFFINLHAVIQDDKGNKKVPAFNFYNLATNWLEEQHVFKKQELEHELAKKDYDWRIAKARYQIVSNKGNVDKLLALLRTKMESKDAYVKAISKTFKLDVEQSESLYESKINIIAKLNVDLLADKIAELEKEIAAIKAKLKDIPGCIVADLQEIEKSFADENLTVFSDEYKVEGDKLKGKDLIVGLSESGKVYTSKFPGNVPNHLLGDVSQGAIVFDKQGLPYFYDASDFIGSLGHSVVAMVPASYDYVFVMDDQGKCIVIDSEPNSKKPIMRDMGEIVAAFGLNHNDVLYVAKKKYPTLEIIIDDNFIDKFCKKSGSIGTNLYSGHKNGVTAWVWHRKTAKVFTVEDAAAISETKIPKLLEKDAELINVFKDGNLLRKGTKVELVKEKKAMENFKYLVGV